VRGFKLHHYPAIALVVYQKPGLALLRKAWFNLDLVWAVALIVTGCSRWRSKAS
jgi:hypothetical protein